MVKCWCLRLLWVYMHQREEVAIVSQMHTSLCISVSNVSCHFILQTWFAPLWLVSPAIVLAISVDSYAGDGRLGRPSAQIVDPTVSSDQQPHTTKNV